MTVGTCYIWVVLSGKKRVFKSAINISHIESIINTVIKISIEAHKKLNVRMYCFL